MSETKNKALRKSFCIIMPKVGAISINLNAR